jgi:hypothetical protein
MKDVPVFNSAVHHDDVWEGGNIAPYIFNLSIIWRCSDLVHTSFILPLRKEPFHIPCNFMTEDK